MNFNRQSVRATASMLGSFRGLSEDLAAAVAALPRAELITVVNATLEMVENQYAHDPEVRAAIDVYRTDPLAARSLAEGLARRAKQCDDEYCRLEEEGRMEESGENFRKMCVLVGLAGLVGSPKLNHCLVDDVVYSLVQVAPDLDSFKTTMLERLRAANGTSNPKSDFALPGIHGFSQKLEDIVSFIAPVKLASVVEAALEFIESEYAADSEIRSAVDAYRADPLSAIAEPSCFAANSLANRLWQRANECEDEQARLKHHGRVEESRAYHQKACVLAALSELFDWPRLDHCVVDDFMYELSEGVPDSKVFAATMVEKVRRRLSQ